MPDIVKSGKKVDSGKDFPRTRLRFVKSIRNRLKKIKNQLTKTDQGANRPSGEREWCWTPERGSDGIE